MRRYSNRLEKCAKDIALKPLKLFSSKQPSIQDAWAYILVCLYGRNMFIDVKEFELARDGTKEIIRLIQWPMDKEITRCATFNRVMEGYDQTIHPENYPPPRRDPVVVLREHLDRVRDELKALHLYADIVFASELSDKWQIRVRLNKSAGENNNEELKKQVLALFPADLCIYFDDSPCIVVPIFTS